jgi:hypothetical protein
MSNPTLQDLQDRLNNLEREKSLEAAKKAIQGVVGLIFPTADDAEFRLFRDSDGKLTTKAGWFYFDDQIVDRRATYTLGLPEELNLDIKVFGITKPSAKTISWAVGLTPNFEDEPFNGKFNVGIDFIIPAAKDSIIIALSKNYVIRTIELKGHLTPTFLEILNSWSLIQDTSRKRELHESLWNSLDLRPINKNFYEGISQRFVNLRQHLEKSSTFDSNHAAQFSNRLLGRVIFTWFIKKKGLLGDSTNYFESESFGNSTDYYRARLETLFFEVLNTPVSDRINSDQSTPYLNGGLFEPKPEDHYKDAEVTFPSNYFDDLYDFLNGYNFTTDESTSEFQQVAIDPEMLGRIFENLLAEVSDDTGEQARKAKGAFYTPREIVDFMCKESLKSYLRSHVNGDENFETRLHQLIDSTEREFHDQDQNWRRDLKPYKDEVLALLDNFKVIDPACGSGAFPIGMMQLLLKTYTRLDPTVNPHVTKLRIIESNIYGVDIEPMAVEISRLRAWLSLLVDSTDDRKSIKPLPNLDFKFVCANSLHGLSEPDTLPFGEDENLDTKLQELRIQYFSTNSVQKKHRLRSQYQAIVDQEESLFGDSVRAKQLKSFRPFDSDSISDFFDAVQMFGVQAFDSVIGNPPYVAPKGLDPKTKRALEQRYGFADDLYSHFFFRGIELLSSKGNLSYISSKTFWTIQTKKNLRELLLAEKLEYVYDTSNPFDSAMVDTCIVMVSRQIPKGTSRFFEISESYARPSEIVFSQSIFQQSVNCVFFPPTETNLMLNERFNQPIQNLMNEWWLSIRTSTSKAQNADRIDSYTRTLAAGDLALLGTLVDGGQGMATGNNGRYLAVISSSKLAEKVKSQRETKIAAFLTSKKDSSIGASEAQIKSGLAGMTEDEIHQVVEGLKNRYGRDALGKGFVYRLVDDSLIANVESLTEREKTEGIASLRCFVPYDKGDREGNTWIFPTPFYIEWSTAKVAELQASSGKNIPGASVIRNPQFYFMQGVCWILTLNESSEYLKARLRQSGVFDVNAMSIFVENKLISEKFLVAILNSFFIFKFKKTFVNNTSAFQINDARQLPIVIPTTEQLEKFELLFDRAAEVKNLQFDGNITDAEAKQALNEVQVDLDREVLTLYNLNEMPELTPSKTHRELTPPVIEN